MLAALQDERDAMLRYTPSTKPALLLEIGPNVRRTLPNLADIGKKFTGFGLHLVQLGPNLVEFDHTWSHAVQICLGSSRVWSKLAKSVRDKANSCEECSTVAKAVQIWANSAQILLESVQVWPKLAPFRLTSGRNWPSAIPRR